MQESREPSIKARLIALGVGLALVVWLGPMFGTWTYETISIYQARESVSSELVRATAVVEDEWYFPATDFKGGEGGGGGSSGNGATFRVAGQDATQTFDHLPYEVPPLGRGDTVDVRLWHGKIVEIESTWAFSGWLDGRRIMAVLMLYPFLLIGSLTVATQLVMLTVRRMGTARVLPRYERGTTIRSVLWATVPGYALIWAWIAVIVLRKDDDVLFLWPPVLFGVALSIGVLVLVKRIRRLRQPTSPAAAA